MLKPLGDKIIIRFIDKNDHTKSGIILTSQNDDDAKYAEVIEVGHGTEKVKIQVEKGQKVIVDKNVGNKIKYEGEDFIIINQNDILAVDVADGDGLAMHPNL